MNCSSHGLHNTSSLDAAQRLTILEDLLIPAARHAHGRVIEVIKLQVHGLKPAGIAISFPPVCGTRYTKSFCVRRKQGAQTSKIGGNAFLWLNKANAKSYIGLAVLKASVDDLCQHGFVFVHTQVYGSRAIEIRRVTWRYAWAAWRPDEVWKDWFWPPSWA